MLSKRSFKSKHILYLVIFAVVLVVIFLVLGIIGFGQVNFLDIVSKKNTNALYKPPQECLDRTKDGYGWSCFRPYFETLTNNFSASAAMAEAIRMKAQRITGECHLFAHFIGEANLEKYDFDVGKAFPTCVAGCNDGCFHGIMSRYLQNEGNPSNLASKIENVCDSLGTDYRQKYRCIHGVGHGLFAHSYLSLQAAIDACAAFGSGSESERICMGGLLMENMAQYIYLDLTEDDLKKILPEVCARVNSILPKPNLCMYNLTLGLMDYAGYNIKYTEQLCEALQTQKDINDCKGWIPQIVVDQLPSTIDIPKFFESQDTKNK